MDMAFYYGEIFYVRETIRPRELVQKNPLAAALLVDSFALILASS